MIGRYKAVLLATYGLNNNLPLTATLYFWVFPWRLVLIIVLVIIALILLTMYLRKRKKTHTKGTDTPKKDDIKEVKLEEPKETSTTPKKVG